IARALDRIERHDAIVEETQAEVARASEAASRQGRELSETRAEAAPRLERLIQRELRTLGMDHARFRVGLRREVAGAEDLASGPDGWRLGARGAESAEFLLSANPGEELKPLAKVVTGGELSRTSLPSPRTPSTTCSWTSAWRRERPRPPSPPSTPGARSRRLPACWVASASRTRRGVMRASCSRPRARASSVRYCACSPFSSA